MSRDTAANDTDDALLARMGRGEHAAASVLSARKRPRLVSLARRLLGDGVEAEDVAQETLIRTWSQAPSWEAGKARIDTWMHRVALNLCLDRLRRRKPQVAPEAVVLIDEAQAPSARIEARQTAEKVRIALDALPERQREAIVLQYYQDMSNIDAAAHMGVSVEALESLLSRARRNLRKALSDDADMTVRAEVAFTPSGRAAI